MRSLLQISVLGHCLVGTCHSPSDFSVPEKRIGVLSMNPGYLPRSTRGDVAVKLGDELADLGYYMFRFDLPGLGDSEGALPEEVLGFFELVQDANYAEVLARLRDTLVERFNLDGIVCLGHCGSATTAAYAEDRYPSKTPTALIMLEPSFVWYRAPTLQPQTQGKLARFRGRLSHFHQLARAKLLHLPLGEHLSGAYARAKTWLRMVRGRDLPADANLRLVDTWRRLIRRKTDMLVLTAEPRRPRPDHFDYVSRLVASSSGNVSVTRVHETCHSFVDGNGTSVVLSEVAAWIRLRYPVSPIKPNGYGVPVERAPAPKGFAVE